MQDYLICEFEGTWYVFTPKQILEFDDEYEARDFYVDAVMSKNVA